METLIHYKSFRFLLIFVIAAFFSGCAGSPALYSWGDYENQVQVYLNTGNPETQIRILERNRQRIESRGEAIPPGFYAHLGMLYSDIGDHERAITYFEEEKALFPEAAIFMNLLLGRYGR